jgi:hypothetical protein
MKWLFAVFALLALVFFMFGRRTEDPSQHAGDTKQGITSQHRATRIPSPEISRPPNPSPAPIASSRPAGSLETAPSAGAAADAKSLGPATREYVVEDGVAVIEGDIVIGLPGTAGRQAQVPKITPWPTHEIPFYIQPSVPDPARIAEALTAFDQTAIRFVPYSNQRDVLVFQNGEGRCKSYMGKIGGKQPIFLAANCGPHEIAHELMHAIGFIHEQNRADREGAIRVNKENIDPTAVANFEKLPSDFMVLTGLAPFDFTSIMLYPPTMFSRNGDPTISSATGTEIQPSQRLSHDDVARINSFYGSR